MSCVEYEHCDETLEEEPRWIHAELDGDRQADYDKHWNRCHRRQYTVKKHSINGKNAQHIIGSTINKADKIGRCLMNNIFTNNIHD